MEECRENTLPEEYELDKAEFWIQIHELPLEMLIDVIHHEGSLKGLNYIRARIRINVNEPLKQNVMISYRGKERRIRIKYERLPRYCRFCGKIGHVNSSCEARREIREHINNLSNAELRQQHMALLLERFPDDLAAVGPKTKQKFSPTGPAQDLARRRNNLITTMTHGGSSQEDVANNQRTTKHISMEDIPDNGLSEIVLVRQGESKFGDMSGKHLSPNKIAATNGKRMEDETHQKYNAGKGSSLTDRTDTDTSTEGCAIQGLQKEEEPGHPFKDSTYKELTLEINRDLVRMAKPRTKGWETHERAQNSLPS